MAKASKTVSTPAAETKIEAADPRVQMAKYLGTTKADHFNLEKPAQRYILSTGSLNLDSEISGFIQGAHRIAGGPNLGKTPFLLNIADTLLDEVPNSRVIWCKAEGRLSDRNIARCRHKIVYDAADWEVGTIFVFVCNVYEAWIGMMRDFITNNPSDCRYGFFTDSLNALTLRNDKAKAIEEGTKVAGAPLLTAQLFQKMGLAMNHYGHWAFFISQKTAEIKLDPYAKGDVRQIAGAGGNSIAHNANETLEFQESYAGDLILEKPEERPNRLTNRPLGHTLKIILRKTDSEKRHITVEIPIKHGVVKGNAIWREREIADQLLVWGLITKGGSWLSITDTLRKELGEHNLAADLPEKVQGLNQLYALLEARPELTEYLFKRFKALISGSTSVPAEPSV